MSKDTEDYSEFIVDTGTLSFSREEGISGFYRVKNEERLLKASVEAHLPYLDEIVIVYNDCTDNTSVVARALQEEYPNKISVYDYRPKVHTVFSFGHIVTPGKSVHSFVNYSNFALAKVTKKIAVKIDADHMPIPGKFSKAVEQIRKIQLDTMLYFNGVNIYEQAGGGIYVNEKKPFTYGFDCGFFPVEKNVHFVHRKNSESLKLPLKMLLSRKSLETLFYHLKGIKVDKGLGNLELNGRKTKEIDRAFDLITNPNLIPWSEAVMRYPEQLADIPEPDLGFLVA